MKDYKDAAHHNYMPISVSLKIRKQFIGNFGVETGLNYTYLHTKFEGDGSESHCHWHYLGIPLKMTFSTFSLGKMRQYVSAGGEFSLPIYSNAVVTTTTGTPEFVKGGFKSNPVWSVSVGYGISFRVSDKVDVFVEPTLQYRFPIITACPTVGQTMNSDSHYQSDSVSTCSLFGRNICKC